MRAFGARRLLRGAEPLEPRQMLAAAASIAAPDPVPAFSLEDVNVSSETYGADVSPRDALYRASGWYFGHST